MRTIPRQIYDMSAMSRSDTDTTASSSSSTAAPARQQELFREVEWENQRVPLHLIEPPTFDEPQNQNNAARSIEVFGMIQQPTLQRIPDAQQQSGGYEYRVIDGKRRIRKLREQDAESVPCRVPVEGSLPSGLGAVLGLTANLNRGPNELDEAQKIQVALDQGQTIESLCRATQVKKQTLRKRARLLQLSDAVWDATARGQIAIGTAERIANLRGDVREAVREAVEALSPEERLTGKDLRNIRSAADREALADLPDDSFGPPPSADGDDDAESDDASDPNDEHDLFGEAREDTVGTIDAPVENAAAPQQQQQQQEQEKEKSENDREALVDRFKQAAKDALRNEGMTVRLLRAALSDAYDEVKPDL